MANLTFEQKSLAENTVEELLHVADEFDAMAARASTPDAKKALDRIAARIRIFAARRAALRRDGPLKPGTAAPAAGLYELRNVFDSRAGNVVQMREGELLPRAPREFTWYRTERH